MGEGTHGVKATPEDLEHEVESIRDGMAPVLDELDHRRHELADMPRRIKSRLPRALKAIATVAALVTVARIIRGRRSRARAARLRASSPSPLGFPSF